MLDDFLWRALIAGCLMALVTGPLGCFVVWRRMAYLGDTIAHGGLLGVALALLFNIHITIGVFTIAALIAIIMIVVQRRAVLSADALLGILSHSTLALGLVTVSLMTFVRVDLMGYLFGDILAVSKTDLLVIGCGGAAVLGVLIWIWRPLLAATVSAELADAENQRPDLMQLILMLLLALVVAMAIKLVGILLITALLIIPAATARRIAVSPEQMAIFAALIGIAAVVGGLELSLGFDTPSGPSIVVAALGLFMIVQIVPRNLLRRSTGDDRNG